MIKNEDWQLFFNQLILDMIFKPNAFTFYRKNGIFPKHWPSCVAKELALEFEEKIKLRGLAGAKAILANRVQDLRGLEGLESFEILADYERVKTVAIARELARHIEAYPERLSSILSDFRANRIALTETFDVAAVLKASILAQEDNLKAQKVVVSLPGWEHLSNISGGFNPGRIFLITAQTGMGKTTLALNLTLAALEKFPVLYFNMEMMPEDITIRLMQIGAGISTSSWRDGSYIHNIHKIKSFKERFLEEKKLLMTIGKALSLEQIVDKILQEKEVTDIGLVIVDYDQKIRSSHRGEEWQLLQKAVEELEEIAKMCSLPILVLAQGDDDGNPRASKRTSQSASAVVRLHKEEDQFYIEFLKNRFGPNKGKILIDFNTETMQMKELRPATDVDFALKKKDVASHFRR